MAISKRLSLFQAEERQSLLAKQKHSEREMVSLKQNSYGTSDRHAKPVIASFSDYLTGLIAELSRPTQSDFSKTSTLMNLFSGFFSKPDPWPYGMQQESLLSFLQQLTLAGFKINYFELQTRQGLIKQLNQVAKQVEQSPGLRMKAERQVVF